MYARTQLRCRKPTRRLSLFCTVVLYIWKDWRELTPPYRRGIKMIGSGKRFTWELLQVKRGTRLARFWTAPEGFLDHWSSTAVLPGASQRYDCGLNGCMEHAYLVFRWRALRDRVYGWQEMRKRNFPAARVLIFRLFSFPFWISCWYFSNMFVILTSTSIGFFISRISFWINLFCLHAVRAYEHIGSEDTTHPLVPL